MFRKLAVFLGVFCWLAAVGSVAAQEVQTPERAIPNQYIIVLDEQQVTAADVPGLAQGLATQHGGNVLYVYQHALRGFALKIPAAAAAAIARNPRVRYVEQDAVMQIVATQSGATWGLDRIDQRDLPLNGTYVYNTTAAGVHAYIIDTGIRATHTEFGGRVSNGYTAVADGNGTNDCNGHGTHVSGTVGGATYGVAKGVTLHPVRVLNCSGSGTTSGVIAGVNWVTANHASPSVANMSLGGSASTALDDAVRNSIASGVTYAIAAGNSNVDACTSSPARVTQALTVGATTNTDARASFSNFGTCVDVFAPGVNITSSWNTSDTATNTISGTSMATPHVTGVAALYLATNPSATPDVVGAAVINNATTGRLSAIGTGSPNRLLYSLFGTTPPVDTPPVASFTYSCSGLTCTFDGSGSSDDHGITGYAWDFGDGQAGSGNVASHVYASGGTFTVTLTVTDTIGQTDNASQSVTVSGSGPCTGAGCTQYAGVLAATGDYNIQPAAGYYYSAAGTQRGWLSGPSNADFDLYLQKWNGSRFVYVAASQGTTSQEQITYTGTAGYYRWIIYSYSGSGSYTFWLQHP